MMRPTAALGTGTVMIDQVVGHIAMIGQVGRYRRHKDRVLDLGRTDLIGLKSIG